MTSDQEEPEETWKIEILAAAERLGWRWFIEERLDKGNSELIFLLGMIVIIEGKEKRLRHRQRGAPGKVGRPRKLRSDMKPEELFLRVRKLQEYFERTGSIKLSQREVIKLLIKHGEISAKQRAFTYRKTGFGWKKATRRDEKRDFCHGHKPRLIRAATVHHVGCNVRHIDLIKFYRGL